MIDNDDLENILLSATDISVVCEIYDADASPGADGFDPNDALGCFAAVSGISFFGADYIKLVSRFGNITRTVTKESNTVTVEFSNLDRQISTFEFTNGFEGLVLVIRLISRSLSVDLDSSLILFVGRCDKPTGGKSDSMSVTAKFIVNALDVTIPRRKYTKDDQEGRVPSDPEFEGFQYIPQYGTSTYSVRVKRGGILGLFGFHKTVQKTLQYSSFSDLDANTCVAVVLGRCQMEAVHIVYIDVGTNIKFRIAWCEGEISGYQNVRSTDANLPLNMGAYAECLGKVGAANGDDPSWPGPGNYSRTAYIRTEADNSAVDVVDPAPQVVGVILGLIMPTWDGSIFTGAEFSNNAAAHARYFLTSDDYGKLDDSWIDDDYFGECFDFNAEQIINTSTNDFLFVVEG